MDTSTPSCDYHTAALFDDGDPGLTAVGRCKNCGQLVCEGCLYGDCESTPGADMVLAALSEAEHV